MRPVIAALGASLAAISWGTLPSHAEGQTIRIVDVAKGEVIDAVEFGAGPQRWNGQRLRFEAVMLSNSGIDYTLFPVMWNDRQVTVLTARPPETDYEVKKWLFRTCGSNDAVEECRTDVEGTLEYGNTLGNARFSASPSGASSTVELQGSAIEDVPLRTVASTEVIEVPTVRNCKILFAEETSAGNQDRMALFVASDAVDGMDRVVTAKFAAEQAIDATGYDFVSLFLIPSTSFRDRNDLHSGSASAWLQYAPRPSRIPFMDERWKAEYAEGDGVDGQFWSKESLSSSETDAVDTSNVAGECDLSDVRSMLR